VLDEVCEEPRCGVSITGPSHQQDPAKKDKQVSVYLACIAPRLTWTTWGRQEGRAFLEDFWNLHN
jgi:hypothetical protein